MMSDTVLHVLVVGFHHKKGCVVEYATPPLITGQDSRSGEVSVTYNIHGLHFFNPILSYLLIFSIATGTMETPAVPGPS